jgi:sugar phosphate isomerase/epimerase
MSSGRRVRMSLAAFPGLRHEVAVDLAHTQIHSEALFGVLAIDQLQLVPQNHGWLSEELCQTLKQAYPTTWFRLHANVRAMKQYVVAELSGFEQQEQWFKQTARLSQILGAKAYTAHAGTRAEASMSKMLENARRAADLFGCKVGVEGLYPTEENTYLVSTWQEYRELFESGVPYALDLSHLNILAKSTGRQEQTLVAEMLACERCIEVHVSDNDGSGDQHRVCERSPWWLPLMSHVNEGAVVFSEGNHRRKVSRV